MHFFTLVKPLEYHYFSSSEAKVQIGFFYINHLKRGLNTKHKTVMLSHSRENSGYKAALNSLAGLRQNNPKN